MIVDDKNKINLLDDTPLPIVIIHAVALETNRNN